MNRDRQDDSGVALLALLFFASGFAALNYQVVWQRALYALYGVNVESVAVIVTAFMLGLGLGSLAGGAVSKSPRLPVVLLFAIVEGAIGVFGWFSLGLFKVVGQATLLLSSPQIALFTFLLLLVPTMLMGATLPLLVAHFSRVSRNVGRSVGLLYFINTLGSAAASFAAVFVLMPALGQAGTVRFSAAVNCMACVAALVLHVRKGHTGALAPAASAGPLAEATSKPHLALILALAAATGFIALSYEILWYRAFSFVSWGHPTVFGMLLGFYLFGVALGARVSRRYCKDGQSNEVLERVLPLFLIVSVVTGYLVIPLLARLSSTSWIPALGMVAVSAGLMGTALPLLAHWGIAPDDRAGQRLSFVYLANIIGSASGSLLTGMVIMDLLGTRGISVALMLAGVATTIAVVAMRHSRRAAIGRELGLVAACCGVCLLAAPVLFDRLYERLLYKDSLRPDDRFASLVENRHGVIAVSEADKIFGGGAYDGVFNTALTVDDDGVNKIVRAYAIAAIHPAPKDVLVIGLSSGSWARVVAMLPGVERITIIEINPGYLDLIRSHPIVAPILSDPRVEIVIDDGRRWMARHPSERFDVIVMNTTYHWRALATNLLSEDFLQVTRNHLKPGGIHLFNTTWSRDVIFTAATTFPHAMRLVNAVAVSDSPIHFDPVRWEEILTTIAVEPGPPAQREAALAKFRAFGKTIEDPASWREPYAMEPRDSILERTKGSRIVTDDNMWCEWKDRFNVPLGFVR